VSDPTRLFGTDGIRAPFGRPPLDEPTVTALGLRLAEHLTAEGGGPPQVVLGGDTRASTPTLCTWLARGLVAGGAGVRHAGVLPTAGVAWLVRALGAATGVVVSASHNPHPDNGIKLLDADGFKWPRAREAALEERLRRPVERPVGPGGDGRRAQPGDEPPGPPEAGLIGRYLDHLAESVPAGPDELPLAGLRIALDAGNGAASPMAGPLFDRLGAETLVLHAEPDGTNVNLGCGSTDPGDLARAVTGGGYHLGAAFDGDADRVILIDRNGHPRDGDAILYLWATELAAAGRLTPRAVVATSMSNLGLERALARHGIHLVRCGVGDREVVESMRQRGVVLGGEQSGHIVHLESTTTGDGLLTALHVAALAAREVRDHDGEPPLDPLDRLLSGFRRYPQVLLGVRVAEKPDLRSLPAVDRAVREVEDLLGDEGRLVLRYSGTEPLARVMIEGRDQEEIEALARRIARTIEEAIGAEPSPAVASNGDRNEEARP
jgi:phosphoglucosamine mutase